MFILHLAHIGSWIYLFSDWLKQRMWCLNVVLDVAVDLVALTASLSVDWSTNLRYLHTIKNQFLFSISHHIYWEIFFEQIYRTADKGWAVRSWDVIPSGAPVCEYFGILRRNDELDNVSGNEFIFDIDCWHTMNEIGGREVLVPSFKEISFPYLVLTCVWHGIVGSMKIIILTSCDSFIYLVMDNILQVLVLVVFLHANTES